MTEVIAAFIYMSGAYGIGFLVQVIYGYVASATSFEITPFVLVALCFGVVAATLATVKSLKKA